MRARSAVALAIAGGLWACGEGSVEEPDLPLPERATHAFVEGAVEAAGGEPVESATVRIIAVRPEEADRASFTAGDCMGSLVADTSEVSTDDAGAFEERVVTSQVTEFTGCLALKVEPPESSGLSAGSLSGIEVEFRVVSSPPDTARGVIVLEGG